MAGSFDIRACVSWSKDGFGKFVRRAELVTSSIAMFAGKPIGWERTMKYTLVALLVTLTGCADSGFSAARECAEAANLSAEALRRYAYMVSDTEGTYNQIHIKAASEASQRALIWQEQACGRPAAE